MKRPCKNTELNPEVVAAARFAFYTHAHVKLEEVEEGKRSPSDCPNLFGRSAVDPSWSESQSCAHILRKAGGRTANRLSERTSE